MIYNAEEADQQDIDKVIGSSPLVAQWMPSMLGGITAIKGQWADGTQLIAVPNYARLNRPVVREEGNRKPASIVWIRKQ